MGKKSSTMKDDSAPRATFRLATLNVHQWEDAESVDNVDRVARLVEVSDLIRLHMFQ